jgi:hypothetical protein
VTGPVVSAHEDGDDLIGVPLGSCRHCSCPLVSGDLCPACTPSKAKAPARKRRWAKRGHLSVGSLCRRVLTALKHLHIATSHALAAECGIHPDQTQRTLYELRQRDYVMRRGSGLWVAS